ncbi:MAG: 30S ribosomal protein S8 [Veillonella sp.]|nr:30S ribosomal protein S8 [Veillonella sp.]
MTDPISDLIVRLKNANKNKQASISFAGSKLITSILDVLKNEGYIANYKIINHKNRKTTIVELKYKNLIPTINGIKQISKPGLRVYQPCETLPRVLNGLGIAIISTSKGILTDKQARQQRLGGEVLLHV